jgi:hypothetical protein
MVAPSVYGGSPNWVELVLRVTLEAAHSNQTTKLPTVLVAGEIEPTINHPRGRAPNLEVS